MRSAFLRVLVWIGISLAAVVLALGITYLALPRGPRGQMSYADRAGTPRASFTAARFAAVAGTPWATEAALEMLHSGGNACDAAVAALLALNVTHGEAASFPGVAPTMYYDAATGKVESYVGAGKAPRAATIEKFRARGFKTVPALDIWAQLVPASPDVLVSLLSRGTKSFAEVVAPAIRVARAGFPVHKILFQNMNLGFIERLGFSILLPYNTKVFLNGQWWRPLYPNDRMTLPDLADTFQAMADAEKRVLDAGGSRQAGLQAVRDYFYKGPIAEKILALHKAKKGLFAAEDLSGYQGAWEKPLSGSYGAYTFYGNGTWSQGIMEPLVLQILDGIDLKAMGHNTPRYIHTVVQAIDLAMADRDAYVGDAAFVKVPLEVLLSKQYAASRRDRMTSRAFGPVPAPGVIPGFASNEKSSGAADRFAGLPIGQALAEASHFTIGQDTSQLAVVDGQGNAVVMTPSDFPKTPMVPGTGLNLGNRMNQFRLDPSSPDALAPGKRPRITPHAVIVFKDGKFLMAYSTPGGDVQPQALAQVFLNVAVFGMSIQDAISAPRFSSTSAPSSFAPNEAFPGHVRLESDLYARAAPGLVALGYVPDKDPAWDKDYGAVGAIVRNGNGSLSVGADPREETTAGGE
jgi:gamma-glutamyltranspeptidase / glutathione hydrolase